MKIETPPRRRSRVIQFALVGSLIFHALLVVGFKSLGDKSPVRSYVVNLVVHEPAATPPPPKPEATPKPSRLPPPNQQNKPVPPSAEPPKPVFGVTHDSVTDGAAGMSVRVGNTLMKKPEAQLTDPNAVHAYSGPPEPPAEVNSDELDSPPKIIDMIEPAYPPLANRARREGVVRLRIRIAANGRVTAVKLIAANPPGMGFEDSALSAVRQWRFEIPRSHGRAVATWYMQSIRFKLE